MKKELKTLVAELIDVAEECPEPYKTTCFRVLLEHHLAGSTVATALPPSSRAPEPAETSAADSGIRMNDIHIKARRFLEKTGLDEEQLNNVFYKDGEDFLPVFDDLRTVKAAETQVRVSLLQAFISAMSNGEFAFDGEAVRSECQERKSYDPPNFARNFKSNAALFEGFETYKKSEPIKLSQEGKERLAAVLRELSE